MTDIHSVCGASILYPIFYACLSAIVTAEGEYIKHEMAETEIRYQKKRIALVTRSVLQVCHFLDRRGYCLKGFRSALYYITTNVFRSGK